MAALQPVPRKASWGQKAQDGVQGPGWGFLIPFCLHTWPLPCGFQYIYQPCFSLITRKQGELQSECDLCV